MIIIEGTLESIVYRNSGNSYTVARVFTEDGTITVVGYFSYLPIGTTMKMSGDMTYHKKYGEQFKIKRLLDAEKINYSNNMEAYLRSGAIAKIGPKTADNIIEMFGEDTYDIFKNHPDRLLEVKGIGKSTLEKIMDSFNDQIDMKEVLIELANYGISNNLANKLFSKYGESVIDMINKNPYMLIDTTEGIGFKTADSIAKESGILNNDENRIEAGLVHLLYNSTNEGHSFLYLDNLINKGCDYLNIKDDDYNNCKKKFLTSKNIKGVMENFEERIYPRKIHNAENYISVKLNKLLKKPIKDVNFDIDSRIRMIESLDNITFGENQIKAIKDAFLNRILIITGGPGTGKTTTLKSILTIAQEQGIRYAIAAPTGRAAKRMEEATGRESKTIHRLLEYQFNGRFMEFGKNEKDPLEFDMIIIDEMSMVDTQLFFDLMKAVKNNVRLILLGDVNQIPSVGSGNVLSDLINSEIINTVHLEKIFRQAGGSMIIDNAHRINEGMFPLLNEKNSDFFMIASEKELDTVKIIKDLVKTRLPQFMGIESIKDIQIMAPMKKGVAGVENLNYEIQDTINPQDFSKDEIVYSKYIFRQGDKVMQMKNNYQIEWKAYTSDRVEYDSGLGIYNGDIGFIKEIDSFRKTLVVDFDGKEVEYDENSIHELTLAYAITIHKSQGSEFPVVVIPIHYAPEILANRNLIYTAITRASKLVVLVGKDLRLQAMIKNTFVSKRNTGLKDKLIKHSRFIKGETEKDKLLNMRPRYN